jgi:signal transduction histidine kinase
VRAVAQKHTTAAVSILAAAATVIVAAMPQLRFAYYAPELRVALETSGALIALLAAYLMLGRFLRERRLNDFLLAAALMLLALSNLLLTLLLTRDTLGHGRVVATAGTLVASLLLAASAFAPASSLPRRRAIEALVVLALATAAVAGSLVALDPNPDGSLDMNATWPHVESRLALLISQAIAMAAFFAAAAGYSRRASRERDGFFAFVAAAVCLAAFARLHYLLFAPVQIGWVHTGDVLRATFSAVLLVGAGREIERYWRGFADAAVLEERRRIARELHDGVAQELAFIARRSGRLVRANVSGMREVAAAADRALRDSRRAISALSEPVDRPLADVLAQAVREVAAAYDCAVDLRLRDVAVDADVREAVVRIACEAVANSARHSGAGRVSVEMPSGEPVRFVVRDDGRGFRVDAARPGHFGLMIMRERAAAVGASFSLVSAPGCGTEVAVELP